MNYKLSCLTTVIRKWIILTGIRSRPVCLFEQHRIVHSSTEPLNLSNMSTVHSEPSPTLQPQLLLLQTERVQGRPAHRSATVYQYISICRVNILLRGTCQTPASLWDTHRQVQLLPPLTHTLTHTRIATDMLHFFLEQIIRADVHRIVNQMDNHRLMTSLSPAETSQLFQIATERLRVTKKVVRKFC